MPRPTRTDTDKNAALALGARIKKAGRASKLSQRQLATELPMSQAHLSRVEAGDHTPPSDDVLLRIAEVLELDPRELLRAARRPAAGETFEKLVLDRLDALTETIGELHAAIARIEQNQSENQ